MSAIESQVMDVQRIEPSALPSAPSSPLDMLLVEIGRTTDMAKLEKLLQLQEQWEANQARKAYTAAMARFKSEPVEILKTKYVDVPGGAKYWHATLSDVVSKAAPALGKHGLSHKWVTVQQSGMISVTCVITHELGHSESTMLTAPPDDSGKKNTIQAIASTVAYLERYTFLALTGLAAKDMDDDGNGGRKPGESETTEPLPEGYGDWAADMRALTDEGSERLMTAWRACSPAYRRHVIKFDEPWWNELKAKAAKTDEKAKAAAVQQ